MIAAWRKTPFGVVVALSGRDPIVLELRGAKADRWIEQCGLGEPDAALIQQVLPGGNQ